MTATTRIEDGTAEGTTLFVSFELGESTWRLAFTTGRGQKARQKTITGRQLGAIVAEIDRARQRFDLPAGCRVVSCYEAGREGFWLHRWLLSRGV